MEAGAVEREEAELWAEAERLEHHKKEIMPQDQGTITRERKRYKHPLDLVRLVVS